MAVILFRPQQLRKTPNMVSDFAFHAWQESRATSDAHGRSNTKPHTTQQRLLGSPASCQFPLPAYGLSNSRIASTSSLLKP